jgi:hypothetical protein
MVALQQERKREVFQTHPRWTLETVTLTQTAKHGHMPPLLQLRSPAIAYSYANLRSRKFPELLDMGSYP